MTVVPSIPCLKRCDTERNAELPASRQPMAGSLPPERASRRRSPPLAARPHRSPARQVSAATLSATRAGAHNAARRPPCPASARCAGAACPESARRAMGTSRCPARYSLTAVIMHRPNHLPTKFLRFRVSDSVHFNFLARFFQNPRGFWLSAARQHRGASRLIAL